MELSTNTIITLGTIMLVICILSIAKRTLSTIMMFVAAGILIVIVIQSTSDVVLIDFGNLVETVSHWTLRLFEWAQETFWPALTDVAREIETKM